MEPGADQDADQDDRAWTMDPPACQGPGPTMDSLPGQTVPTPCPPGRDRPAGDRYRDPLPNT